uniref:Secreted protein n=1 Tax=Poecilia mexicana TaxID=48701 RepID=A0A3B3XAV8_9TELE
MLRGRCFHHPWSGCSILLNTWQLLVVTELTPAHHSRENIQRSLTTYMFTLVPFFRKFLPENAYFSSVSSQLTLEVSRWISSAMNNTLQIHKTSKPSKTWL